MPTITRRESLHNLGINGSSESDPHHRQPAELFGQNVFSLPIMRQVLPKAVYQHMLAIYENGASLDLETADVVAAAMKDWALARGATHYCHWFHPLHGQTAEKHQSFLLPSPDGGVITEFTGENLLQGEPDASSFPSGGTRSTFEARGYTGWDPTSPCFLMEGRHSKTMCIPSVFVGFNGQSLDKKVPLLRSGDALSRQALRILKLFGNDKVTRVSTTVGCEQEYFLIDRKYYLARPDLVSAGRTLFGAPPPKGQEMEDHYFGTIKERALAYMEDLELSLYKLGIPVTARHNEVAPSQFEMAPVFEQSNIATDHNLLMMSVMRNIAHRHGYECLLHEKPFAGVNGSGKHNNWSMADDAGNNLLEPGQTPQENAQFLVFLTATVRALHLHGDLMRASIATPSNDHRLGANEAPPAIISIYLGDTLSEIINAIVEGQTAKARPQASLDLGVSAMPPLPKHDSDRNRTSPFAFTGNKFEFRAVGSEQNVARPNMVLNTIVADSLSHIADKLEQEIDSKTDFNAAVQTVVQRELKAHHSVIFGGDNYNEDWHREAENRGLPNLPSCVEAIPAFISKQSIELFARHRVLDESELRSRYLIKLENYVKSINIEAGLMSRMGSTMILPAAFKYQKKLASSISHAQKILQDAPLAEQTEMLRELTASINEFIESINRLDKARVAGEESRSDVLEHARHYRLEVLTAMTEVRIAGDKLETVIDDDLWPLPKYHEMLFLS